MRYTAKTDRGQIRENNEDFFYANVYDENTALFIVADGLGGYASGEVASKMTVNSVVENFELNMETLKTSNDEEIKNFFRHVISMSNEKVYKLQKTEAKYKGMGTTIVLVAKINGKMYYESVGDSRLYYIDSRKEEIQQVTIDDTYVNELLKKNLIKEEEVETHPQKHVLTKAVGVFNKIDVQVDVLDKDSGYLILCSDGLTNMLTDEDILKMVITKDFDTLSEHYVVEANAHGGRDNITVIAVEI